MRITSRFYGFELRLSMPHPGGALGRASGRSMTACAFFGLFLVIGGTSGAADIPPEQNVKAMCVFSSSGELAAWRGPVASGLSEKGQPFLELTRDRDVFHAVREFKGPAAEWGDYSWLRLEVETRFSGRLSITIRESDEERLEPWVGVAKLAPRRQSVWFRLAAKPDGDLILGAPQRDREWNPDTEQRLTLTLTPGTGRLRVFAVDLVRDREAWEKEKTGSVSKGAGPD